MALTFINSDGGKLPADASAPTASQLLADFGALTTEQRAAFLTAIAPAHFPLSSEAPASGAASALAGDTAFDSDDSGNVWACVAPDATRPSSWINLLGGQPLTGSEPTRPNPPLAAGGHLPGGGIPGTLMSVWNSLSATQRAAFRAAIKPVFSNAANQAARLALSNQKPGDWCREVGAGLYRLRVLPATTNGNWDLIYPF